MRKLMQLGLMIPLVSLALLLVGCASKPDMLVRVVPIHERDIQWYGPGTAVLVDPAIYTNGVYVVSPEWLEWGFEEGLAREIRETIGKK